MSLCHITTRRNYGTKCSGCYQGILPTELVRKARNKSFHLKCFTCFICRKQLTTGDELYIIDNNKFICKADFNRYHHNNHNTFGEYIILSFLITIFHKSSFIHINSYLTRHTTQGLSDSDIRGKSQAHPVKLTSSGQGEGCRERTTLHHEMFRGKKRDAEKDHNNHEVSSSWKNAPDDAFMGSFFQVSVRSVASDFSQVNSTIVGDSKSWEDHHHQCDHYHQERCTAIIIRKV